MHRHLLGFFRPAYFVHVLLFDALDQGDTGLLHFCLSLKVFARPIHCGSSAVLLVQVEVYVILLHLGA
jgi:hypothetical protein